MSIEIERRFLLKNDDWRRLASAPQTLQQGYLSVEKELILITVGISDPESLKNTTAIKNNIKSKLPAELFEKASIYHLRGSIDYSKLSFPC